MLCVLLLTVFPFHGEVETFEIRGRAHRMRYEDRHTTRDTSCVWRCPFIVFCFVIWWCIHMKINVWRRSLKVHSFNSGIFAPLFYLFLRIILIHPILSRELADTGLSAFLSHSYLKLGTICSTRSTLVVWLQDDLPPVVLRPPQLPSLRGVL